MKTILEIIKHDTFTILGTLFLIGFLAYLFKNAILKYLQKKFDLFTKDEILHFLSQSKLTNGKSYRFLKMKLENYKEQRDARK